MVNEYPDTFLMVQYHVGDSYQESWCYTRATFYNVQYTPTVWFDGLQYVVGASTQQGAYNNYLARYQARVGDPSDVKFRMGGEPVTIQRHEISVEVSIEPGGTGKTMRIYMVEVLDHYPVSPNYHRNCFRQTVATQDVTLAPGESAVVQREFLFDAASWGKRDNIKIIVWAQEASASGPAEVHQSAFIQYPFDPPYFLCPGDFNWDGQRDYTDFTVFSNAWQSSEGDPNWDSRCDLNEDGNVDYTDFTVFSNSYLVPCPE